MLDLVKAIILGIIQGLTEFLPISSSGHLMLGQHFLGFEMPGVSFEVMLHLGSLFAVIIYFRKGITGIIGSYFTVSNDEKYSRVTYTPCYKIMKKTFVLFLKSKI